MREVAQEPRADGVEGAGPPDGRQPLAQAAACEDALDPPLHFLRGAPGKGEEQDAARIGAGIEAPLQGKLLEYFDVFDFSIFEDRTPVELIEEHAQTIFYAPRFGGGLPPREQPGAPPVNPGAKESLYLQKLLDAYGSHLGEAVAAASDLEGHPELREHYNRQRVLFYSAESLRNFARDRTPAGTFDSLQYDAYYGIIDVCESNYRNGLERLRATVSRAAQIDVSGNALVGVTKVADKQGICHQLANDDRVTWTKSHE